MNSRSTLFGFEARVLLGYYLFLIVAWSGAWLLHEATSIANLPAASRLAYWTVAKSIVWILPMLVLVRHVLEQPAIPYLGLTRVAQGVRSGLAVGVVFIALSACIDVFTREHGWPSPSWALLSALTIAPLFEEVMFRGFALRTLEESGFRFWSANSISALMFLGLHLPGWYFMKVLDRPQIVTAFSVFLIGLVAGYAKRRSGSTWASVTLHFVNNVYSACLR